MTASALPTSPIGSLNAIELTSHHVEPLQSFFVANPEYFLAVQGEPAGSDDAQEELLGDMPSGLAFSTKRVIGYVDQHGDLLAMANVLSDIFEPGVWNVSTFIVATSRHGSGDAQSLYQSLESWAASGGARWMRLGVVQGNRRAERFWESCGYKETRKREGFQIGKQVNTLRVMFKSLCGGTQEEYLSLVSRDRPE